MLDDATHTKSTARSSNETKRKMPPKTASNKRKTARGTKKNPWVDDEFVMTSEKSPLVDIDLAVCGGMNFEDLSVAFG